MPPEPEANNPQRESALPSATLLDSQSKRFHAFEWLRGEALKDNKHAETLMKELVWLNGVKGQAKNALLARQALDDDSKEMELLASMVGLSNDKLRHGGEKQ